MKKIINIALNLLLVLCKDNYSQYTFHKTIKYWCALSNWLVGVILTRRHDNTYKLLWFILLN